MAQIVRSIVHPTDFSDLSMDAFAHALKIALAAKSKLYLLNIGAWSDDIAWSSFPHVRRILSQWGLLEASAPKSAVAEQLGIEVVKAQLRRQDPVAAIQAFIDEHSSDLIVLATHGREGLQRWLHGSLAEELSRLARVPTLFIPPNSLGFVDQLNGNLCFNRILVPVDHSPSPEFSIAKIQEFARLLNEAGAEIRFLHVGTSAPPTSLKVAANTAENVELRSGDPIDVILETARSMEANMIALPTAGHHGFVDAIRGSTTERILRKAPCAVLALPAEVY